MKIVLMQPLRKHFVQATPDLGLGYLASILKKHNHEVKIILPGIFNMDLLYFKKFLSEFRPDVVGIKVNAPYLSNSIKLVNFIKAFNKKIKVVVGGAIPSFEPEKIFDYFQNVDFAFSGEAEIGFLKLIELLKRNDLSSSSLEKVPGLIWKDNGKIFINSKKFVENLDEIPFPSWDLMDPSKFPKAPFHGGYKRFPYAPMILTRGCPYNCTFCGSSHINGKRVRARSAKNFLDELKLLYENYKVREIQLYDSNCAFYKDLLIDVCKGIIKENFDIAWNCPNGIRLDSLDEELVFWMRKAGCYEVCVGIESGSERILKMIKKGISIDLVREKVNLLNRAGIRVIGYFIIGFPTETKEEIENTLKFSLELPLFRAGYFILCPYPGTKIYDQIKEKYKIKREDIDFMDFRRFKNNLSELSYEKLRKFNKYMYFRFYLRPHILIWNLANIKSFSHFKTVLKYFFRHLIFDLE